MTVEGLGNKEGLPTPEVDETLVNQVRQLLVKELREFSKGRDIHPGWKTSALELANNLEAGEPCEIGGRSPFPVASATGTL